MKNYVWTEYAEEYWKGIKESRNDIPESENRKANTPATFAHEPIAKYGTIAKAWLDAGFIKIDE